MVALAGGVLSLLFGSVSLGSTNWEWKDADGRPAPNTDARKSMDGFGGWLLITSDANWEAIWTVEKPAVPRFTEAKVVARGDRLYVLIFFANPLISSVSGQVDVGCDIDVERPDKSLSLHQKDTVCYKGRLQGSSDNIYLALPVIGFFAGERDLSGRWVVRVQIRDRVRNVDIPLQSDFVLE
jgi:hypothetical protein